MRVVLLAFSGSEDLQVWVERSPLEEKRDNAMVIGMSEARDAQKVPKKWKP